MARRFGNFRKRFRGYGGRAKAWYGRRSSRTKSALGVGAPYLVGVAIGLTDYDKQIPYEVKIALAALPTGVTRMIPGSGPIVNIVRGMLIGDIIQARTGFNLAGASKPSVGSGSVY